MYGYGDPISQLCKRNKSWTLSCIFKWGLHCICVCLKTEMSEDNLVLGTFIAQSTIALILNIAYSNKTVEKCTRKVSKTQFRYFSFKLANRAWNKWVSWIAIKFDFLMILWSFSMTTLLGHSEAKPTEYGLIPKKPIL